ncbi:DUF3870 domain-containing protein [Alicyclobacillus sp.]|uniref:DUF3870 domain-containing protein n=1 Tax=Alicyclobacillus sp. TaxID=61169 RepID=UPI0025C2DDA4|nr:DUF3870 domain-containing protein [Alicyclobacillus sp.]MCL6516330.1 DUF3870 domain-containing protein [Alicyclobacillus sp.]
MAVDTILVTGYAPAPKGSSMYEAYKTAGVVLEINPETNILVRAEFTFVTDLAKDYVSRLVNGYDLSKGIEPLVERIQMHYFTPSTEAVIMALRVAYQRYQQAALPKLAQRRGR